MNSTVPNLSVIIMARNEAARIADCLASVPFANEVIVADTGSTDATAEVARSHGARVEQVSFEGFGPTKQKALDLATGAWILSLDADERVTSELAKEIQAAIVAPDAADGYFLPRRAWFLGRRIHHGGWGCDRVLRLFRRGHGRCSRDPVHERIEITGRVARFQHALDHHSDPTLRVHLAKIDRYSTLAAARIAADKTIRTGVGAALAHGGARFFKVYVYKSGWRDGIHGALLAASGAYSAFLRYAKADLIRRGAGETLPQDDPH